MTQRSSTSAESISVIVPSLNEEENLTAAIQAIYSVLEQSVWPFEILIFDDGSTDGTGSLAESLAASHSEIRVIHNRRTEGLGACYRRGVELARCDRVVIMPGDNQVPGASLARMCAEMHIADIVVPYVVNAKVRSGGRRALSSAFTGIVNTLFGLHLRYYNGPCIHRRPFALAAMPNTNGFAYMAILIVRLVTSGCSVQEVGIELKEREGGRSKAFGPKNLMSMGVSLLSLFVEVRVLQRRWRVSPSLPSTVIRDEKIRASQS